MALLFVRPPEDQTALVAKYVDAALRGRYEIARPWHTRYVFSSYFERQTNKVERPHLSISRTNRGKIEHCCRSIYIFSRPKTRNVKKGKLERQVSTSEQPWNDDSPLLPFQRRCALSVVCAGFPGEKTPSCSPRALHPVDYHASEIGFGKPYLCRRSLEEEEEEEDCQKRVQPLLKML